MLIAWPAISLFIPAFYEIRTSEGSAMLDKTYSPAEVEAKHYDAWEKSGAFAANPGSNAQPYTIMMPPPNVTGSLHMGHALTFTLQDI